MRFAIATNDAYLCVLDAFLQAGWQLEKLFFSPGDRKHDNKQVIALALKLGAAIQHSPLNIRDLADLGRQGCAALVVASYQWKIPEWSSDLKYAVNFHPSPLPEGRGPYPLVRAILEERSIWAVTCHQINDKFDQGDILDAESFFLDADTCHESLLLKSQMACARLATRVAKDFENLWQLAIPQGAGSYWPLWSEQDRTIDFNKSIVIIMRQIRAFGDLECMAMINNVTIFIHRANSWLESHTAIPGTVVYANSLALVVAAADGYIAIIEWSFNAPDAITSNLRR